MALVWNQLHLAASPIMFDTQLIVKPRDVNIDSATPTTTVTKSTSTVTSFATSTVTFGSMECFSATFHEDSPPPATLDRCWGRLCYSSSTTVQDTTVVELGCWPDQAVPSCFTELHRSTCLCATPLCNAKAPSSTAPTPPTTPCQILAFVLLALSVFSLMICIIKIKNCWKVKNDKVQHLKENKIISVTGHYLNIASPKNSHEVVLYEEDPEDYLKQVVVDEQNSEDLTSNENTYSEIEMQTLDYNQVEQTLDYNYNQVEDLGSPESLGYQETVFLDTTKFALNARHMDTDNDHQELRHDYQEMRYAETRKFSFFEDTDLYQSEGNFRVNFPDYPNYPDELYGFTDNYRDEIYGFTANHPDEKYGFTDNHRDEIYGFTASHPDEKYGFTAGHYQDEGCSVSDSFEYLQNVSGTIV